MKFSNKIMKDKFYPEIFKRNRSKHPIKNMVCCVLHPQCDTDVGSPSVYWEYVLFHGLIKYTMD